MKVEIFLFKKDKIERRDLILLHDKYPSMIMGIYNTDSPAKCGYWVYGASTSRRWTFYAVSALKNVKNIELRIDGKLLNDDVIDLYIDKLHYMEINSETEVGISTDGDKITEIHYPESLLYKPVVGNEIEDMYMGGIGEFEHIGVRGRIIYVKEDKYFIVTPIDDDVDDLIVKKGSWKILS